MPLEIHDSLPAASTCHVLLCLFYDVSEFEFRNINNSKPLCICRVFAVMVYVASHLFWHHVYGKKTLKKDNVWLKRNTGAFVVCDRVSLPVTCAISTKIDI